MACIEFCLLSLHKQKDYNLKGNYVFISAMCIETLVQSRTFVCFRTNTNGNNVGWGGNDVQRLQLWIHCMEMEWNLFIAEISQFNLHFNAFSPALIICRLFSKLFHRFRLFHSVSVPCFRRQIIAMTGQSQWWIPIFFVVTCFRPNKWRKSRHSNKYQRQSWNSFSLTESRLYWHKRTPKKTHRTVFIRNASVRFMSSNKVETNDFLFLLSHFFIVSICCSSSSNDNGRLHNKNRLTNWTAAIVIRVRFN